MNSSSRLGYIGGTAVGQIASQTLASTVETEFQLNLTGSTTGIAVLTVPQTTDIVGSSTPFNPLANSAGLVPRGNFNGPFGVPFNTASLDNGRPFLVRLAGLITPASNGGNTLNIILYQGTSKSGQAIASTTAFNLATTTTARAFILESELIWDSTSQVLNGQFWWRSKATSATEYVTWATATAATSVTAALLKFCASATWGNSAGGKIDVSEFSVSQL